MSLDTGKPRAAKVHVNAVDIAQICSEIDWMKAVGVAIRQAITIARPDWSDKEWAARIDVDTAEFSRWLSGDRRPQFDRLFAVEVLRRPLVLCLAGLAGGRVTQRIDFPDAVNE